VSPAPSRAWRHHVAFVVALSMLAGVHLALVDYFFGAALPLPEQPFTRGDFATHANQARHVIEGLEQYGQHWIYDVQLLAGAPNGALFDADVKGWELWTFALVKLGVGWGRAYNAYVLAVHLCMPVVVYAAARTLHFDRWAALATTTLAVLLWSFDSFTHWMWFIGTVTYVQVAYFALVPLALFYRWLEDRRPIFALGCALCMAVGHLVHPYIFFILVAPMLALYIRAAVVERDLCWGEHAITWGIAGLTLIANFWWLKTALRSFQWILDSAYYEQGGVEFVVYDLLGLLHDASTQGMIGPHTAVRVLAAVASVFALASWRRRGDRRWLPVFVLIVSMAALAYLGGYTPAAQIQPYRHALPLGFALTIPAGWWLAETLKSRAWRDRGVGRSRRAWMWIVTALATAHLVSDAAYFFAPSMPSMQKLEGGVEVPINSLGHGYTPSYRYDQQDDWEQLIAWVDAHDDGQSRWLVTHEVLGEYLMARTDAQILGGFRVRNLEHSDANWFRRAGAPPYRPELFQRYLEDYGVGWVIVPRQQLHPWWEQYPRLLTRAGFANGMIVYQVNVKTALLDGPGRVDATTNRIAVSRTQTDQDLVLRYHWMQTLRCEPDCRIVPEPLEGDRIGFMRVLAPHPRDFVIENAYAWD
jgi:hypothetical protein